MSSNDSIWDNDDSETVSDRDYKSPEEWKRLCLKYRAKIIDFGFARALTPGDMEDGPSTQSKRSPTWERHPKKKEAGYENIHQDELDRSQRKNKKNSGNIFNSRHSTGSFCLDGSSHSIGSVASVSHKMKRVMSTLGNRNYAAPEIVNKVRQFSAQEKKKERENDPERNLSQATKTISSFVADYGLLVDSYSMGHTIKYMMTGVQPGVSIDATIKKQQRAAMAKKILSKFGFGKKKKSQDAKKGPRKPFYRSLEDIPGQVVLLIEELTELSPQNRLSIRKARRTSPWICDTLSFQKQTQDSTLSLEQCSEEQLQSLTQTRYLPMATLTPGSVVSTLDATAPTVTNSNQDFPLDTSSGSDRSACNLDHVNNNNNIVVDLNNNDFGEEILSF